MPLRRRKVRQRGFQSVVVPGLNSSAALPEDGRVLAPLGWERVETAGLMEQSILLRHVWVVWQASPI
ncbi:MAG: hypothetical protein V3U07_04470 [Nitrospirales bacterium]